MNAPSCTGATLADAPPHWLPPILSFGGDWATYQEQLHHRFLSDFENAPVPPFRERPVELLHSPRWSGKSRAFWHMTTTGKEEANRTPEFRRCERIAWARTMLEVAGDTSKVLVWRQRREQNRWAIALLDFSYAVILNEERSRFLLWTTYYPDPQHVRDKLRKDHEAYLGDKKTKPPR